MSFFIVILIIKFYLITPKTRKSMKYLVNKMICLINTIIIVKLFSEYIQ